MSSSSNPRSFPKTSEISEPAPDHTSVNHDGVVQQVVFREESQSHSITSQVCKRDPENKPMGDDDVGQEQIPNQEKSYDEESGLSLGSIQQNGEVNVFVRDD